MSDMSIITIERKCDVKNSAGLCAKDISKSIPLNDFTFDAEYISLSDDKISLNKMDTNFNSDDFSNGTHSSTEIKNQSITIGPSLAKTHVNYILPERESDLRAYWRFEDNFQDETTVYDGTSLVPPTFTDGKLGRAIELNGVDQYLILEDSASYLANYTISFWFKYKSGSGVVIHRGQSSGFCKYSPRINYDSDDGALKFSTTGCGGVGYFGQQSIDPNEWYYVTMTQTNSPSIEQNVYINGELVLTANNSGNWFSNLKMTLGTVNNGNDIYLNTLNAQIDELAIWNIELTADEVSRLYSAQASPSNGSSDLSSDWTPNFDDLVAYWKFDNNTISSVSNNTGSLIAETSYSTDAKVGSHSVLFDGVDDAISVTSKTWLTGFTKFTTIFWIRPQIGSDYNAGIIDKNRLGEWSIHFTGNDNQIKLESVTQNGIERWKTTKTLNNDTWYHVALVYDSESLTREIYINGKKTTIAPEVADGGAIYATSNALMFGATNDGRFFSGSLDDVGIFNNALSHSDINLIYNRQKQKFAGSLTSNVLTLYPSSTINSASITTPIPFDKSLLQESESSDTYSLISGDLSNGLVGYWPLDETTEDTAPNGSDFEDKSPNENHGDLTNVIQGENGITSNSAGFNEDAYIVVPHSSDYKVDFPFSISSWVKVNALGAIQSVIANDEYGCNRMFSGVNISIDETGKIASHIGSNTGTCNSAYRSTVKTTNNVIEAGKWYHIITIFNSIGDISYYLNGIEILDKTYDGTGSSLGYTSSAPLVIGNEISDGIYNPFNGNIDEVAIWNRSLNEDEITQLYRRGANRVKYQIRTCTDATCSDDPEWLGPSGDGTTYFSELYNRASSDLLTIFSGCDVDNICTGDELVFSGDTLPDSFSINFVDTLVNNYSALNAQYFQYRVLLEAEENSACNGEACLSSVSEINFETSQAYYSHSPSITSTTPIEITDEIISISESVSGGCNVKYQFSKNGSDFYFYSGSWILASDDVAQANTASEITDKIANYISSGPLYIRAYLSSDGAQACTIKSLSFNY